MSWDEPVVVAERLAACLGRKARRWPARAGREDVLLLAADQLDDVPAQRLERAAATVVVGTRGDAASDALRALRERVEARGLSVALATFATALADGGAAAEASAEEAPLVVAAPAHDARVRELLAAGAHGLMLDTTVDAATASTADPPARVCVVSFEVSGLTGGGIGTASTSLAELLARAGHDVTLLFTGVQEAGAEAVNEHWRTHCAQRGVRMEILREPGAGSVKNPTSPARSAYEVYCWLRAQEPFDVVHLPENMGHGAYAQLAKRHGASFTQTTFAIGTHGPTRWAAEANRVALTHAAFLVNEALERTSVELADVLLGPSRYLHDYMRERAWTLPARVHVQPYATPSAVRPSATRVPRSVRARSSDVAGVDAPGHAATGEPAPLPDEFVFFGRIETRKGVVTLCDALDLLTVRDGVPPFAVTFLGPVAEVLGQAADAYVAARAARWPWRWQIVSDRDQQGAAEYLARPRVLAVMPSLVDNAPNTVSEAIALGVPLVAARAGGTGELVAAELRDDHMFGTGGEGPLPPAPLASATPAVDPAPLAELLLRRLTTPVAAARPAAESEAVDAAYDLWHRAVRRAGARPGDDAGQARALPTLTACVLFDGDAQLLAAQLASLADADGVEVVVADLRDGEGTTAAPVAAAGVTVVRGARPGHAADARSAALAATTGALVAVVPQGDVPLPSFAGELRRIASVSAADVYACAVLDRLGDADADADADERGALHAFVPLPGPPLAGLGGAAFTAGPYAIRRAALEHLGGFADDAAGDEVDDELLNRALTAGMRLEVIAEPLAAKRRVGRWAGMRAAATRVAIAPPYDAAQWLRVERPFAIAGDASADLPGLLRGARTEAAQLRDVVAEQHDVYEARLVDHRAWIDDLEGKAQQWRSDHAALLAEIAALRDDNARLGARVEELSQTAAQLVFKTLRAVARRLDRARGR